MPEWCAWVVFGQLATGAFFAAAGYSELAAACAFWAASSVVLGLWALSG